MKIGTPHDYTRPMTSLVVTRVQFPSFPCSDTFITTCIVLQGMKYSEEDCIESLKECAEGVNGILMVKNYRSSNHSPSVKTLENKFGSWNDAKKAAGLEVIEHGQNEDLEKYREKQREDISSTPASFRNRYDGYEVWMHSVDGVQYSVRVHRLVAVAKCGIEAVKNMDVHHKNGVRWDNRPENLDIMTRSEHMSLHHKMKAD